MDQKPSETPPPVPSVGGPQQTDGDPLVGSVLLGRVRIVRPLARGGMGKVYFGEQTGLGRPCAIKVLDPRLAAADAGDFVRRFLLEASVASKLAHPNVVTIFDYGETADGSCFIAMEYLDGRTLADDLKNGPIAPERAVHITRQVCRALREAHALNVVHRDVKPGNVFLVKRDEDNDFVKVLDFGLVGEAQTQEAHDPAHASVPIMGSPKYMAPEQVQGKPSDARTDVYAVGAMLYAMLAGRPPFERATELATMMAQVSDAPRRLASAAPGVVLPAGLEGVVMKCLAKNPDHRYSGMDELLAALKIQPDGSLAASESGPRSMPNMAPPLVPVLSVPSAVEEPKRGSATIAVAVLSIVVVAGLFGASELHRRSASAPASQAVPSAVASAVVAPTVAPAPKPTATLHVETIPPGAKVKEEGDLMCDATPCDIVYSGEGASPNVEHLLVFMKPDYKLERKLVTVDLSAVRIKLTKAK